METTRSMPRARPPWGGAAKSKPAEKAEFVLHILFVRPRAAKILRCTSRSLMRCCRRQLFAVDHKIVGTGAQAQELFDVGGSKSVRFGAVKDGGWT
jgi:hypothetical protein